MLFFSCSIAPAQTDSTALTLKSETTENSADIYLKEGATEDEKKEDKERRRLGIGESVKIWIGDKAFLMEPIKEIRWTITKGKHLLTAVPQLNGVKEINLTIRKDLRKSDLTGGLEIKASTKKIKEITPINFEIVFPEGLTGEHIPTSCSNGSIREGCPPDGDLFPSASAQILVSIYPTDVSFSGIWIIEKDNGYFGEKSSLATEHEADSIWSVTEKNQLGIPDDIGAQDSLESLNKTHIDSSGKMSYDHSYPNEFAWDCLFKTYSFNVVSGEPLGVDDISHVKQSFYYDRRGDCFYIKISKYASTKEKGITCSVERVSGGNHIFKP